MNVWTLSEMIDKLIDYAKTLPRENKIRTQVVDLVSEMLDLYVERWKKEIRDVDPSDIPF